MQAGREAGMIGFITRAMARKHKRDFARRTSNAAPTYGNELTYVEGAFGVPLFYDKLQLKCTHSLHSDS